MHDTDIIHMQTGSSLPGFFSPFDTQDKALAQCSNLFCDLFFIDTTLACRLLRRCTERFSGEMSGNKA